MALQVIKIPETINRLTANPIACETRRRAAAYARVSSDHSDQLTSYAAQVDYYTRYIQEHEDLEFVRVYTDEGISGTSTARRAGFRQMIADALAGEIDLIITKSVSRFARNTVDGLSTIRLLKENKVECYFEKENINTFDSKGELLLTIMASLAQEEARSISENCVWGQHKRFADGKVTVPFKRFLGYDRGGDGGLIVNAEQAETVREIYRLFLEGISPYSIAKRLTEQKIPTPGGKTRWYKATVTSILSNEKYKGDALLQKVYTTDYLTKHKKFNEGELPQYYVDGDHEAIISAEIFEQAQAELERRHAMRFSARRDSPEYIERVFLPKLFCGKCGKPYTTRVLRSTHGYRRTLLQSACACGAPHLVESEAELIFIKAVNSLLPKKESVIAKSATFSKRLESTKALKNRRAALAADPGNAEALAELDRALGELLEQKRRLRIFRKALKLCNEPLRAFDEQLWIELIEHISCSDRSDIRVTFIGGTEVKLEI